MTRLITHKDLKAIWEKHQLGMVKHVQQPARGSINQCLFVNRHYVIRFDMLGGQHAERFHSEALAYQRLAQTDVPVPEVIALDTSQALVPYTYLITTRMDGQPIIDSWVRLSTSQRYRVAHQAGRYLALIHQQTFPRFGKVALLGSHSFENWYRYVVDHLERYLRQEMELSVRLTPETIARIWNVFANSRPLLEAVHSPSLLHSDFQFENIIQRRGHIRGVVDFEWAMTGDASWDFVAEDQWERFCPGSKAWLYESYEEYRALDSDHHRRVTLYKIILYLETAVSCERKDNRTGYSEAVTNLTGAVAQLEAVL